MAESSQAWVTLATNDSYSLGAMVLAHSLRRVGTTRRLVVMITHGVTLSMQEQLRSVFDDVRMVDVLDSQDAVNLALLARPDLGITFTKLHCWRLTNYTKCVFLDADTLVLQPCDELFDREELSAAPDPGWPDIFNSGVFVYTPSESTYQALLSLALTTGSFDGGDQGLLNTYFSDWATRDINRHLPFLYNMCSPSFYSYLPAFKQFGEGVKIAHFIGPNKPWSQYFDSETRQVRPARGAEHLKYLLQFWWDLFCAHVHPHLKVDMPDAPQAKENTSCDFTQPDEQQSHRNLILPQLGPFTADSFYLPPSEPIQEPPPHLEQYHEPPRYPLDHFNKPLKPIVPLDNLPELPPYNPHHQSYSSSQSNWDNNGNPPPVPEPCNNNPPHCEPTPVPEPCNNNPPQCEPPPEIPSSQSCDSSNHTDSPRPPSPSSSPDVQTPQLHMDNNKPQAGLASAFSQMTMGSPSPAATVEMQEHLRRAAWEQGNADYMGADAFDKIWSKIMDTVSQAPASSSTAGSSETK